MGSTPKKGQKSKDNDNQTIQEPDKKPFRFGPGNSFGGRPKGSRNKLSEAVITDLLNDWEVAGPSAIQACRLEDPAAYVRIVTSLIPKEFNFKQGDASIDTILEQFSDDQLADVLATLAAGRLATQGSTSKTKALPRAEPDGVH